KPVYMITGGDRPKIERALRRLRSRFDENSVELLSATTTTGEEAVAACNAMGLFGGDDLSRLVLVEDVDGRRDSDGRLTGGWKAKDVEAVTRYLAEPAPTSVLALLAEELKPGSELAKTCRKAGDLLVYDVTKRELPKWVVEQFKQAGVSVDFD